jgi:hypothetical protein
MFLALVVLLETVKTLVLCTFFFGNFLVKIEASPLYACIYPNHLPLSLKQRQLRLSAPKGFLSGVINIEVKRAPCLFNFYPKVCSFRSLLTILVAFLLISLAPPGCQFVFGLLALVRFLDFHELHLSCGWRHNISVGKSRFIKYPWLYVFNTNPEELKVHCQSAPECLSSCICPIGDKSPPQCLGS